MPFQYLKNKKKGEWVEAWENLMDKNLRGAGIKIEEAHALMRDGVIIEVPAPYRGAHEKYYRWVE